MCTTDQKFGVGKNYFILTKGAIIWWKYSKHISIMKYYYKFVLFELGLSK